MTLIENNTYFMRKINWQSARTHCWQGRIHRRYRIACTCGCYICMLCHCRSCTALPTAVTAILLATSTRDEPKNNWMPSGKVWKVCYKYSLTAHIEQWGDNKMQNNSLVSGGCPSSTMDDVGPCVQLDISHAVKGCTRMKAKNDPNQGCTRDLFQNLNGWFW